MEKAEEEEEEEEDDDDDDDEDDEEEAGTEPHVDASVVPSVRCWMERRGEEEGRKKKEEMTVFELQFV